MKLIDLQTYNSPDEVFLGPSDVSMLKNGFDIIIPEIIRGVPYREINA